MTLLAGFLDVLLRGVGLAALSASAGGVLFAIAVLRPRADMPPLVAAGLRRSLALVALGAGALALAWACLLLVLHPWALAEPGAGWPLRDFLATGFARAGLSRVILAAALCAAALALRARPATRARWLAAALLSGALVATGAWLAHASSRLDGRAADMAATALHQSGAVAWAGGVIHMVAFALLWRARGGGSEGLAVLRRFTLLAAPAVACAVAGGVWLSWSYIGSWAALVGTGYGLMTLTKVALLGCVLALAAVNLRLLGRGGAAGAAGRLPALLEAEVGIGLTVLLAASSLTSLPPAVDVVADRATPSEVAALLLPRAPRLSSPPVRELLAAAAPITDTLSARQPEEFAWSEYNHHVAGLFVLAMGLLAFVERTGRAPWARHWPLLFLGLGVFLFVRNDPRAWPLGPAGFWETMALPDVLQHRLVVLLVAGLALFEWSVRAGRLQAPGFRLVFPVLCAVGGAILLTHSHAMLSLKSEFLAELSHAPMGVLAVVAGWSRWLELRLPAADRGVPGWAWAAALVGIGFILLGYREA